MFLVASSAEAQGCEVPGPDAGGYKCETTTYQWLDTTGGSDVTFQSAQSERIELPFSFPWYGTDKTSLRVGYHGLLCFDQYCGQSNHMVWLIQLCQPVPCPPLPQGPSIPPPPSTSDPDGYLACFWETLAHEDGFVRYKTVGTAPSRVFVVEFNDVAHVRDNPDATTSIVGSNTFQAHLTEGGEARCMLKDVGTDADTIPSIVAGESHDGSAGTRYRYSEFVALDAGVRFFCTAPSKPRDLTAESGPGLGQIKLRWQTAAQGCAPTKYKVFRGTESGNLTFVAEVGSVLTWTDDALPNGALRYYQVSAVNPAGEGPRSDEASATTPDVPAAPTGVTAERGPGTGALTVRWGAAAPNGAEVTRYRAYRGLAEGAETDLALDLPKASTDPAHPARLPQGGVLALALDADDHDAPGSGQSRDGSPEGNHASLVGAPPNAAARFGRGYDLDGSTQHLEVGDDPSLRPSQEMTAMLWFRADSTSGQRELLHKYATTPTGYFLEIDGGQGRFWGGFTVGGTLRTATTTLPSTGVWHHAALTYDGAAVRFYVDGALVNSTSASGTLTQNTRSLLVGLAPGGGRFDGLVDEPRVFDRALTAAEVQDIAEAPYDAFAAGLRFTDTGLANDTTYHYRITATNAVGEGPRSAPASARTAGPPGAPAQAKATSGPGAGQITLSWAAPADDGGSPVLGYRVHRGSPGGALTFLAEVGTTAYTDQGLAAGSTWAYAVAARNALGEGARATAQGTAPVVPGAPRDPVAARGPGAGSITVSWAPPATDGGTAVTGYRVYRGEAPGALAFHADLGDVREFQDTGIPAGAGRSYALAARNGVGEGLRSAEVWGEAPTVPAAPAGLAAVPGPGAGQITLTWVAPGDDGGLAVSGYRVYRGPPGGVAEPVADLGSVRTWTDSGLVGTDPRSYQVSARNGVGEGARSEPAVASPPQPPSAPRGLAAEPTPTLALYPKARLGGVKLSWTPPASDGGLAVQQHRVYRGNASGQLVLLAQLGNATTFTDDATTPLHVYYYQVSAVNPVGEGPRSAESCAPAYPWIFQTTPLLGRPCPAPAGWAERTVFAAELPLPSSGLDASSVRAKLVEAEAGHGPDARLYEVRVDAAGRQVTALRLPTFGPSLPPFRLQLPHAEGQGAEPSAVHVRVVQRYDPSFAGCAVLVPGCVALPVGTKDFGWWFFQGPRAVVWVEARLLGADGTVLAEGAVTLPYLGQAGAAG